MSIRTDLYIVRGTEFTELANLACKLSEKVILNHQTALILCADESQARNLDELMWSFKSTAFVPHRPNRFPDADYPVAISTIAEHQDQTQEPTSPIDALIYLAPVPLVQEPKHNRRLIVVNSDQSNLNTARNLYKELKQQGCEINSHDLR